MGTKDVALKLFFVPVSSDEVIGRVAHGCGRVEALDDAVGLTASMVDERVVGSLIYSMLSETVAGAEEAREKAGRTNCQGGRQISHSCSLKVSARAGLFVVVCNGCCSGKLVTVVSFFLATRLNCM